MVEMPFHFQAFKLEGGIQNGKDKIVLSYDPSHRRFSQGGVLFERFMEDFHRPSFLIGR
jgi:hypothetical protein